MYEEIIDFIDRLFDEVSKQFTEGGISADTFNLASTLLLRIKAVIKSYQQPSEDLEKAAGEYIAPWLDKAYEKYGLPRQKSLSKFDAYDMEEAFEAGAQWQKEQFEKNRLAACDAQTEEEYERETAFADEIILKEHRHPTFNDAINYGMRLQREQMVKDAVVGIYNEGDWGTPCIDLDEPLADKQRFDKVKLLIIKEDAK